MFHIDIRLLVVLGSLATTQANGRIAPGLDDGIVLLGAQTAFEHKAQPYEEAQSEMSCAHTLRSTRENPSFRGVPSLPYCAALETAIGLIALHDRWPDADRIASNARMLAAADLATLGIPQDAVNGAYAALEGKVRRQLRQIDAVASAPTERYVNKFGNSHLSISHLPRGGLHATLDTGGSGCGGQVSGSLIMSGAVLHMSRADDSTNALDGCDLDVTVNGSRAVVRENHCMAWHGASCEFNGTYQQIH